MKKHFLISGLVFLFLFSTIIPISFGYNIENSFTFEQPLTSIANKEYSPHEPIFIDGNNGFIIGLNGIISGEGTHENPYIIKGWEINASTTHGIYIKNSDVYFIIKDSYIHDGWLNHHSGIFFSNVINGGLNQTNIIENYVGVNLEKNCKNIIISNCSISYNNYNGINTEGSMINIIDNNISNNLHEGINLYSINSINNYNTINGNLLSNNKISGIDASYVNYTTFTKNIISSNYIGISLSYSNENNIVDNLIYSNFDSGIYVYSSFKNNIMENNIFNNHQGLEFIRSNDNYLSKNIIDANKYYSIWFYGWSNSNNIILNNISNSEIGIFFPEAVNNKIQQNNLIKNKVNVIIESSPNIWNENYWGRTKFFPKIIFGMIYFIPLINIDWHPAKKPYGIPIGG